MQIFSVKEILVRVLGNPNLPGNLETEELEARDAVWKKWGGGRSLQEKPFLTVFVILTVKQKPDLI